MDKVVQWPAKAEDPEGADLGQPVEALLHRISALGEVKEGKQGSNVVAAFQGTPTSVAIIEAGGTALAKGWAAAVAAIGGAGAFVAWLNNFWSAQDASVQAVAIGGLALLLVSTVIAVAAIVRADISARGQGAVALYELRKEVTIQFLHLAKPADATLGKEANRNDDWRRVRRWRYNGSTLEGFIDGQWVAIHKLAGSVSSK